MQQSGSGCPGPFLAERAVSPVLDQFDIVVAESPEERLGSFEGAGVIVLVERGRGLIDQLGKAGENGGVERLRLDPADADGWG